MPNADQGRYGTGESHAGFVEVSGIGLELFTQKLEGRGRVCGETNWVILRYRIHEALERAESDPEVNWAALAAELGYSDQAHLIRDFTATVGVPPTTFAPR